MSFVLAILLAQATQAVPATGVEEEPRRGTYLETSLGVFTAFGGSAGVSNAQPYLGLTLGHELGEKATVFVHLGLGSASASCFQVDPHTSACAAADSFGLAFLEAGASYGVGIALRTLLSLKLMAGATDLSPGPVVNGSAVPDSLFGFHFGAGLALDYDTRLPHFALGVDVLFRYTIASYTPKGGASQSLGLASAALLPRIRYVF
jgi:hypothetical protein